MADLLPRLDVAISSLIVDARCSPMVAMSVTTMIPRVMVERTLASRMVEAPLSITNAVDMVSRVEGEDRDMAEATGMDVVDKAMDVVVDMDMDVAVKVDAQVTAPTRRACMSTVFAVGYAVVSSLLHKH